MTHSDPETRLQALVADPTPDLDETRALFDAALAQAQDEAHPLSTLELAAFVLSQVGTAEDVWRMAAAKFATPRTASAFPGEFLVFAGVDATRAFVRDSDHPLAARVRYYLFDDDGACYMGPERLERWARTQAARYALAAAA